MRLSLRRWRPGHLIGAWIAWWCSVIGVTMGRVIIAGVSAASAGGSITGGLLNDQLGVTVVTKAGETVVASASLAVVAAVVVLPPLALWVLWLRARPSRDDGTSALLDAGVPSGARSVREADRAGTRGER